jgi:hypothetical protein
VENAGGREWREFEANPTEGIQAASALLDGNRNDGRGHLINIHNFLVLSTP